MSRSRLYHALCPLWACACQSLGPFACVATSIPPRACLDVTTCEIHLCGIGVPDTHLSPLRAMLICLPYLFCATHLAFFASSHICFLVSSILQSNGSMDTWTKPIFVLLGHPLLFDNMLVCPFICLACFVCPHLALFISMFFACSPYLLCLSASLFPCLLHVHA